MANLDVMHFLPATNHVDLMWALQTIPTTWRATGGRQGSIQKGGGCKRAYTKTTMPISRCHRACNARLCGVAAPIHNASGWSSRVARCGHRITPAIDSPVKGRRGLSTNVGLWEPLQGVQRGRWTWIRDTRLWHRQHIWSRWGTKRRREPGGSLEGDYCCSLLGAKTSSIPWFVDSQWSWPTLRHEGRPIWLHHCAFQWSYCKGRGTVCVTRHNPSGTSFTKLAWKHMWECDTVVLKCVQACTMQQKLGSHFMD